MAKASNALASEAKEVLEQIVANIEIKDPDNTMSKSEAPKMTKKRPSSKNYRMRKKNFKIK